MKEKNIESGSNLPPLNQRLLDLRFALKLSQTAFAKKLGLSPTAVWKFEQGGGVSAETLSTIVAEFGANSEWLLTGVGTMFGTSQAAAPAEVEELRQENNRLRQLYEEARDNLAMFRMLISQAGGLGKTLRNWLGSDDLACAFA